MAVLTTTEIPRPSRGGRPRDPSRDGVIRAAILRLLAVWRESFDVIWRQAEQRGEVRPGLTGSTVAETTSALMVQRWLLTGEPVDEAYADEVLRTVVLPLVRAQSA